MKTTRRIYEYELKPAWRLFRAGKVGYLAGTVVERVLGRNPYLGWLTFRGRDPVKLIDLDGYQLYIDLADRGLSRHLYIRGSHEVSALRAYREAIGEIHSGKERILAVEVGANIGYVVHELTQAFGDRIKVLAFEPDPQNRYLLKRNLEHNATEQQVQVSPVAVSSTTGTAVFVRSTHSNWSRIDAGDDQSANTACGERLSVETTSLDAYLKRNSIAPSSIGALRMDIEGHELSVVKGMETVLRSNHPMGLFIEFHPETTDRSAYEATINTLHNAGFSPRFIGQDRIELDADMDTLISCTGSHVRAVMVRDT